MTVLSANIQANTTGFKSAVESAKRELELFNKSNKALAQTMRGCNDVTDLQISAFSKSVNALEKATAGTKTYKQSAALLEKELQKLKQQWSNLSDKAKQGEFGRYMSESINQTKAKLAELNNEMSKPTKSWGELAGQMNVAGVNVGDVIGKLKSLNPAVLGAATAAKVMTDAFRSSETAMDGARRTMSGLQSVYDTFIRSVRDGNLDFSNIFGAFGRGSDKYDAEDALASLKANNKAVYEQLQADIAEAREKIADGGDADINSLKTRVGEQYRELIRETQKTLDKSVDEIVGADDGKRSVLARFVLGKNPNESLNAIKAEAARMEEEISSYIQSKSWKSGSAYLNDETYKKMASQQAALNSIIEDETKIQEEVINKQAELNALKKAESDQVRVLNKMQNQIANNEKQRLNELKKAEEDRLKVLQKEREEAKKLADETERTLGQTMKGRASEVQVAQTAKPGEFDKSELDLYSDGLKRVSAQFNSLESMQKKVTFEKWTGNLGTLNSGMSNLYDTMKNLNEIDNPFQFFDSILGVANNIKSVVDAFKQLGMMIQAVGAINQAETETAIAMNQSKAASNNAESASAVGKAASETMAAHASIPFAGIAIGAAAIGTMIAILSATKSKVPKFADGGIVGGNSSIGDYNIARVNSGEMILNGTQQKRLFNLANGLGGSNETMETPQVEFKIKGQDLVGVFSNYNNKRNRVR